jgi:hypothetical protein
LRARLGRDLARDIVDIGKRQRADKLHHADLAMMLGEQLPFMRPAAAP